jgi:decaprenylphospho-beta-D-ribofuranose 2-oxidase
LVDKTNVHIHYAWLRCTKDKFLENVLSVNAMLDPGVNEPFTDAVLEDEGWGTSEILRAGWDLSRTNEDFKKLIWKELETTRGSGNNKSRLNWMRTSVSFTASRGDAHGVDILQEYFVPLNQLAQMVTQLKTIFTTAPAVNVLSSTIRLVRADNLTNLSYSRQGNYASIAIDAHIGVQTDADGLRTPDAAARRWITDATEAAIALGGGYYLPYYKVADAAQFARAYSAQGIAAQRDAIAKYNPDRKFWNGFLEKYFA